VNLQEQGTLLLQNDFITWKNKRKTTRHVFLFEHLLVLSKTRKVLGGHDQYIYKTSLKVYSSLQHTPIFIKKHFLCFVAISNKPKF